MYTGNIGITFNAALLLLQLLTTHLKAVNVDQISLRKVPCMAFDTRLLEECLKGKGLFFADPQTYSVPHEELCCDNSGHMLQQWNRGVCSLHIVLGHK